MSRQIFQAVCANDTCGKNFAYKHGRASYLAGPHYCSGACRNTARAEKILLTCSNPLCGKQFEYTEGKAHLKRTTQHYCCRSCQNTTHGLAGTPKHEIWERARKRARLNNLPFSLTVYDIPDIPSHCPVLGIEVRSNTSAGPIDSSPSIDRLIPSMGYVPGNIRIICNRANRIRSDASAEELRKIADDALILEQAFEPIVIARKPA